MWCLHLRRCLSVFVKIFADGHRQCCKKICAHGYRWCHNNFANTNTNTYTHISVRRHPYLRCLVFCVRITYLFILLLHGYLLSIILSGAQLNLSFNLYTWLCHVWHYKLNSCNYALPQLVNHDGSHHFVKLASSRRVLHA